MQGRPYRGGFCWRDIGQRPLLRQLKQLQSEWILRDVYRAIFLRHFAQHGRTESSRRANGPLTYSVSAFDGTLIWQIGLGPTEANVVAGRLLGIFGDEFLQLCFCHLVCAIRRTGAYVGGSELRPEIGRTHIEDPDGLEPQ
jgi:hypothetical protein